MALLRLYSVLLALIAMIALIGYMAIADKTTTATNVKKASGDAQLAAP